MPATPKPNFLTPPATEEDRPKLKRNLFHNWVDSSDWRPRDIAMMTPEERDGYEKGLLRERPKYVPIKPEVVARLSLEDKLEVTIARKCCRDAQTGCKIPNPIKIHY